MYEYKCVVTVDQISDFSKVPASRGVSLQIDLDALASQGWEIVSCVLVEAKGIHSDQICWHTVAKRKKDEPPKYSEKELVNIGVIRERCKQLERLINTFVGEKGSKNV